MSGKQTGRASSKPSRVGVFVLSAVRLYREMLAEKLARDKDLKVLGSAESPEVALREMRKTAPEVVLVDVCADDGLQCVRGLARSMPEAKILALGVSEPEDELVACAEAGADGCIPRSASFEQATEALRSVARGETICSPRTASALIRRVRALAMERRPNDTDVHLTWRELEVLELMGQRLSNKEIASRLSIEVATVKTHVHNILQKLQLHRRTEVGAYLRARLQGPRSSV